MKGKKTGGRKAGTPNKATASLRESAQEFTSEALNTVVAIMRDPETPATTKLSAATAILDRGHGKPRLEIEQRIIPVDPFPDVELLDEIRRKGMEKAMQLELERRKIREKLGINTIGLLVGSDEI